jgi:Fe-S-cluster containining protein
MSDDILKKPVHLAILKPTHIQKLAEAGKLPASPYGLNPAVEQAPLPAPTVEKANSLGLGKLLKPQVAQSDLLKKNKKQLQLRIIHDRIPPLSPEKVPPCNSCKTAACCVAFAVNITQQEYDSGLYGDAAVALTPDMHKQLQSKFLLSAVYGSPKIRDKPAYFLDGKIGEPCPFLTADKRCGIYDIRPATCRTYTCVGDSRITEGMRQGTEGLDIVVNTVVKNRKNNVK